MPQLVDDPRIQSALDELQGRIKLRYPGAAFHTYEGEDPTGVYLDATIDIEDTDEVMDLIIDRLIELQIDQGLPLYVIPVRPIERVAEELQAQKALGKTPRWGRTATTHP